MEACAVIPLYPEKVYSVLNAFVQLVTRESFVKQVSSSLPKVKESCYYYFNKQEIKAGIFQEGTEKPKYKKISTNNAANSSRVFTVFYIVLFS